MNNKNSVEVADIASIEERYLYKAGNAEVPFVPGPDSKVMRVDILQVGKTINAPRLK